MILSGGITVCRCEDGILGHYVVRRHEMENWTYLGVVGSNYSRRWFARCAVAVSDRIDIDEKEAGHEQTKSVPPEH